MVYDLSSGRRRSTLTSTPCRRLFMSANVFATVTLALLAIFALVVAIAVFGLLGVVLFGGGCVVAWILR